MSTSLDADTILSIVESMIDAEPKVAPCDPRDAKACNDITIMSCYHKDLSISKINSNDKLMDAIKRCMRFQQGFLLLHFEAQDVLYKTHDFVGFKYSVSISDAHEPSISFSSKLIAKRK